VTQPLSDAKRPLADRRDRRDLDVVDASTGWALVTPCNNPVDRRLRSLELQFDRAVAAVSDPSRHTLGAGDVATRITEEHALHTSTHDDTNAYGGGLR